MICIYIYTYTHDHVKERQRERVHEVLEPIRVGERGNRKKIMTFIFSALQIIIVPKVTILDDD